jgi:hypothetical protein
VDFQEQLSGRGRLKIFFKSETGGKSFHFQKPSDT